MHNNATKCNKTLSKWCKNKHGASKVIDTFETYQELPNFYFFFKLRLDKKVNSLDVLLSKFT
jgi:hypothetical protein